MTSELSIYIHIPFCKQRCSYCDFVTFAGQEQMYGEYVRTLCTEIETVARRLPDPPRVHTIYLGGGTPSVLPSVEIHRILATVKKSFDCNTNAEITLEANPGTLSPVICEAYSQMGICRISLGVQSTQADELALLGRIHDYLEVEQAVADLRSAGNRNLSLDLIYGLPGQTLGKWQNSLARVLEIKPEHLSLYSLTVEEGTPLASKVIAGELPEPDSDIAADQLIWSCQYLKEMGYRHYEISNWCRTDEDRDFRSKHNLQYWTNDEYLGFGVGAYSYWGGLRIGNPVTILDYQKQISALVDKQADVGIFSQTGISTQFERMQDEMMLGLRLLDEGVNFRKFRNKYGKDPESIFKKEINKLEKLGLVERIFDPDPGLRLTEKGMMLGNQVFMEFVGTD